MRKSTFPLFAIKVAHNQIIKNHQQTFENINIVKGLRLIPAIIISELAQLTSKMTAVHMAVF
jgi:hypothetical protein